jgi:citrate/tricarballylate utilization protein
MLPDDLIRQGQHVMTVCNACRYCEGYCAVFPAMENRLAFSKGDLTYLANLCHNCGECLYACPYAPPHEFAINVPRTLAEIRLGSYEEYCWPRPLSRAFRRHQLLTALALALGAIGLLFASTLLVDPERLSIARPGGDFYRVMPHDVMVAVFGGVSAFVVAALITGLVRFWRDAGAGAAAPMPRLALTRAFGDVLTLKYLHADGVDCTSAEEVRRPWRRWFHHLTFYGFTLCFASTSVAALYHVGFGWRAPYAYSSLPVVLGTAGGLGLLAGPAGLFFLRRARDEAILDPAQGGLDTAFIALLLLTSLTGLVLLVLRDRAAMPALLIVHLGLVLALFLMLPYGKFVHGMYRTAALIKYGSETLHHEATKNTKAREVDVSRPS